MKKLAAILLVAIFSLAMLSSPAMAQESIQKTMSQSEADLGDIINVTLVVEVTAGQTVVDTLPDELGYVGNFQIDGSPATPTVVGQDISYTFTTGGSYTITFDAQVTSAEAVSTTVSNTATVGVVSDTADLTINPYGGFDKNIVSCSELDPCSVPVSTPVEWIMEITVTNIADGIDSMQDIVVKDNLGGDLKLLQVSPDNSTWYDVAAGEKKGSDTPMTGVTVNWTGKTLKVHLTWNVDPLPSEGDSDSLYLRIATDVNPGGQQEYTDDVATQHELNSGATLKFTDSNGTGLQLSAHTEPIPVVTYIPVE